MRPGCVFSFVVSVYGCEATQRTEKTYPGLCPSKGTAVSTLVVTSDSDSFVNVIKYND